MESNGIAPQNPRQKGLIFGVFVLMVLIVAAGVYFYVRHTRFYISTDDADCTGRIYTIAPKVPGTIKVLLVQDNQFIKQGDLLLTIDSTDYDVRVRDASALLATEQSKLSESQARIELSEKQLTEIRYRIESAQANLKLQEVNLSQARQDLTRAQRLFQKTIIPQERLEKAQTTYDVTQAQTDAAREQLKQTQAALGAQAAGVEQAKAAYQSQLSVIAQRKAALNTEQLRQSYTQLFSPAATDTLPNAASRSATRYRPDNP